MINLFKYYKNPEQLDHYQHRLKLPRIAWMNIGPLIDDPIYKKNEKIWARDAKTAIWYAGRMHKPFPLGEPAIATDHHSSVRYAILVLKAPFKMGEQKIAHPSSGTELADVVHYTIEIYHRDPSWIKKYNPDLYERVAPLFVGTPPVKK